MNLTEIYKSLLNSFGSQNWWPINGKFKPKELEICIGAILTQNTNWANVERALAGLKKEKLTSIDGICDADMDTLEKAIQPSGFFRQKAKRLKGFSDFVKGHGNFKEFSATITRDKLLELNGIGPETADSILLYALNQPVFVIDAYTKRVFTRFGFNLVDRQMKYGRTARVKPREDYELWRWFFESTLPKDNNQASQVGIYQEFHALIVELAKRHCRKRPKCTTCPLEKGCKKQI
jgi:endonuclease-3 related protein